MPLFARDILLLPAPKRRRPGWVVSHVFGRSLLNVVHIGARIGGYPIQQRWLC